MSHLTDLQCSMAADDALQSAEHEVLHVHLASCETCRNRLQAYRAERQILASQLQLEEFEVPEFEMPDLSKKGFKKPITLTGFALANVATGLVVWFTQFLWKTLFGELIVNAATRVTAFYLPNAFEIAVDTALYVTLEGTRMLETYLGLIILALTALVVASIAISIKRSQLLVSFSLALLVVAGMLVPESASALEIRRSESTVTIQVSETINDTLMVAADTVIVDGNVQGDLVTAARRIIVNGNVDGNLIAMGKSVSIYGKVGGSLISANDTFEMRGTIVEGNLWSASGNATLNEAVNVAGNAIVATELASIHGSVGRDLYAFGDTIELSGSVGEDFEVFAADVRLLGDAAVGGTVRARVDDEEDYEQSATANIGGSVEFLSLPEEIEPRNRYATSDFYLRQLFRLASAFIAGVLLLWLIPVLRDETLESGSEGLKTAAIGLVALVSAPIVAVLCAATVIGIPLALIGLFGWAIAVYLAKIVVASMVGQMVLGSTSAEDNLFLTLLAGLGIVVVATALPAIGGILNFVMTIVGLGMIVQLVLAYLRDEAEV